MPTKKYKCGICKEAIMLDADTLDEAPLLTHYAQKHPDKLKNGRLLEVG